MLKKSYILDYKTEETKSYILYYYSNVYKLKNKSKLNLFHPYVLYVQSYKLKTKLSLRNKY